ncbi:unnamed protein product [Protopolystoma xenopodis]|uniref:Uncharacterized protein n=1 Tax=Protopolystoma xenopodis TaxID=117903 RepID=A0A3S5BRT9_9PLAT|nr:unnamed protein product [Protopolystoma xenopodis]
MRRGSNRNGSKVISVMQCFQRKCLLKCDGCGGLSKSSGLRLFQANVAILALSQARRMRHQSTGQIVWPIKATLLQTNLLNLALGVDGC